MSWLHFIKLPIYLATFTLWKVPLDCLVIPVVCGKTVPEECYCVRGVLTFESTHMLNCAVLQSRSNRLQSKGTSFPTYLKYCSIIYKGRSLTQFFSVVNTVKEVEGFWPALFMNGLKWCVELKVLNSSAGKSFGQFFFQIHLGNLHLSSIK